MAFLKGILLKVKAIKEEDEIKVRFFHPIGFLWYFAFFIEQVFIVSSFKMIKTYFKNIQQAFEYMKDKFILW